MLDPHREEFNQTIGENFFVEVVEGKNGQSVLDIDLKVSNRFL